MALPNLNIVSGNEVYRFILKQKSTQEETIKFRKLKKSFVQILKNHKFGILKNIERLIGSNWKEKDINIYLIPENSRMPSIAMPLILKLRENQELNLFFLTHELIHRFFFYDSYLKNLKEVSLEENGDNAHAYVDYLTIEVMKKVLGKTKVDKLRKLEKDIVTTRNMEVCDKLVVKYSKKYQLDKKPLIKYLKEL